MKGNKGLYIFPATLLFGFGLYYFIRDWLTIELYHEAAAIIFVGLAFFFHAYFGKQYDSFLPAALFLGLGIHLHLVYEYQIDANVFGLIFLFLACGFFLRAFKTKSGSFYGWIFFIFALLQLFPEKVLPFLQKIVPGSSNLSGIWPILLILAGVYIFFFKRK